jgi:SAM-dependent MidA family methyltransferase
LSSYHSEAALPAPDADAIAHSERLIARIAERIAAAGGVLPFDEYMQACLYEPGLGYYSAGAAKLGKEGDFVTAPEISPLFGRTLARFAGSLFDQGLPAEILEFGGGSGRLCRDLMQSLGDRLQRYRMLEPSPDLRQRQQQLLRDRLSAEQYARIEWLDALPPVIDGLVLGNEVLDAMPVKVLLRQRNGWRELGVAFEQGRFVWCALPEARQSREALEILSAIGQRLGPLPDGYATELNLNYRPWCRSLADSCGQSVVLMIDYGYPQALYYHPSRTSGTLQCFYRHRVHGDPFVWPGLQDITAFVDFDAFAAAACEAGLAVAGIASQGDFLIANGLLELPPADEDALARLKTAQQIKTLTLPGEMGEKFKCIALQKGVDLTLTGINQA